MEGAADEELLRVATAEDRIMVSFDAKDFSPLVQEWAAASRPHAGCIIAVSIRNDDFGALLRRVRKELAERPDQGDWRDITIVL